MTNALIVMPAMEIAEAINRRNQLNTFVKEIMINGIDFGTVPGTDKPTLKKPGAEKLVTFFALTPTFEDVGSITQWEGNEPLFFYRYKCKLYRGVDLIGEGIGSCNNRESKYRWRWVNLEDIPYHLDPQALTCRSSTISEFEFAINKRETGGKYGKPASYWDAFEASIKSGEARQVNRKSSKGVEYPAWEIATTVYRVPNEDIFSQINTIDKMAQKRALVAAVLIGVNASEFFTQDLEDLETVEYSPIVEVTTRVIESDSAEQTIKPAPETPHGASADRPTGKPLQQATEAIVVPSKPETVKALESAIERKQKAERPLSPADVKHFSTSRDKWLSAKAPGEKQATYAFTSLSKACEGDNDTRHIVVEYLFGIQSMKDLTAGQCSFIIDWCGAKAENDYTINEDTMKEIRLIVREAVSLAGQTDMFDVDPNEPAEEIAF